MGPTKEAVFPGEVGCGTVCSDHIKQLAFPKSILTWQYRRSTLIALKTENLGRVSLDSRVTFPLK
ncbi:hypothetical protein L484_008225 [Morus notabilis]|uniref:Uncharacterized protein n=1 Tax=Morus notabilis TaxID=981085 RepID=W9SJZ7_9ROSA|nr:hypothetical protein L484_008225 [Morus notabilis]